MSPGSVAQIKDGWQHTYRKPGTPVVGLVQSVSPSGAIARVRFDNVMDSYIAVSHLEAPDVDAEIAGGVLAGPFTEPLVAG